MINTIVDLSSITFQECQVEDAFLESIAKHGIAIPVQVKKEADGSYLCVDGNKRLSACKKLYPNRNRIPVMITNDFSKSGSSFWGNTQNHH